MSEIQKNENTFYNEISELLKQSRNATYRAVNTIMVQTYWQIGKRIVEQEQYGQNRANYGDYLIVNLSRHLTDTFGKGFSEANLKNIRQFYIVMPEFDQFATHCVANLTWSNIRYIMRLENKAEREYNLKEASEQNWSFRTLERNIKSGYYRRLLSTQEKDESIANYGKFNLADFIKDPFIAEFLNIPEDLRGKESLLENALIDNMQKFLLELGKGFSFVDRQMRISTETSHFYVDLVFYNYLLKCFVIIDLKTSKLTHFDIGQMDMYVRMFDYFRIIPPHTEGVDSYVETVHLRPHMHAVGMQLRYRMFMLVVAYLRHAEIVGVYPFLHSYRSLRDEAEKDETIVKYSVLNENQQLFASKYKTILPTEDELAEMISRGKIKFEGS